MHMHIVLFSRDGFKPTKRCKQERTGRAIRNGSMWLRQGMTFIEHR